VLNKTVELGTVFSLLLQLQWPRCDSTVWVNQIPLGKNIRICAHNKTIQLGNARSEDIKEKQYTCFCNILYIFKLGVLLKDIYGRISLKYFVICCYFILFSHTPSCAGNQVQTDRMYCVISKITREVSTDKCQLIVLWHTHWISMPDDFNW